MFTPKHTVTHKTNPTTNYTTTITLPDNVLHHLFLSITLPHWFRSFFFNKTTYPKKTTLGIRGKKKINSFFVTSLNRRFENFFYVMASGGLYFYHQATTAGLEIQKLLSIAYKAPKNVEEKVAQF